MSVLETITQIIVDQLGVDKSAVVPEAKFIELHRG